MKVVVRPEQRQMRSAFSFTVSACVHGAVLGWVALGPLIPKTVPPNLYEQEIRPYEHRLVWYNLKEPLPDISPARQSLDPRPPRARIKSPQTLVAGSKDTPRPSQMIWLPAPVLDTPRDLPSPNVVALTPPARPVRAFSPVEPPRPKPIAPGLPEAPLLAETQPNVVPLPPIARPQPRAFAPPPEERPVQKIQPALPAAPEITVAMAKQPANALTALPKIQPARRTFIPPVEATHAPVAQPVNLPAPPPVEQSVPPDPTPLPKMAVARAVRPFAAPPPPPGQPARPVEPIVEPPAVTAANRPPEAALAIVSLLPTRNTEIPAPKASQQAGFSAGPQPQATGGDLSDGSQLVIPGLLARGATRDPQPSLLASLEAPTSPRNLMAAARAIRIATTGDAAPRALVTAPPEARMHGRVVYTLAIQMPNVTSYSGSWTIWFAEREPVPGQLPDLQPPEPMHKVDPKYVASAADERVEGKIRLAAVIRKSGHVDTVELLRHLDNRLDVSAEEALAKWEFAPALRNGAPVDVDAVFEIPFHLAPRPAK